MSNFFESLGRKEEKQHSVTTIFAIILLHILL